MKKVVLVVLMVCVCASAIQIHHVQKKLRAQKSQYDFDARNQLVVTLSYMDEEAASVLRHVLNKRSEFAAVFAIERAISGNQEKTLWERPLLTYPVGNMDIWLTDWDVENKVAYENGKWKNTQIQKKTNNIIDTDHILKHLKLGLEEQLNKNTDIKARLQAAHLKAPTAKVKTCLNYNEADLVCTDSQWYPAQRIYTFGYPDQDDSSKPVAIVIRTPEMGMDMISMEVYNRAVMRALKRVVGTQKINLFAIGASGAASREDCVGRMRLFEGSLFVGSVPKDNLPSPYIGYDNVKDEAPIDIYKGVAVSKDADKMFEGMDALRPKDPDLKNSILPFTAKGSNEMTASYFMGVQTKMAADSVHLHAANTEDFWIIHLIQEMKANTAAFPEIKTFGVFRVDADPYPSPEDSRIFVEREIEYIRNHVCLPKAKYLKALQWQAEGMDPSRAHAELCWVSGDAPINLSPKYFAMATYGDNQKCALNPLLVEAATDLIADSGKIGVRSDFKLEQYKPNNGWEAKANTFLGLVATALKQKAGIVREDCEVPLFLRANWAVYEKNPRHFKKGTIPWSFSSHNGQFFEPDETGADRMLYKASNMVVLDQLAKTLFADGANSIFAYAKKEKQFPRCQRNIV